MKSKTFFVVSILLFTIVTGCVPSLNPLYHEDDLVFVPELIGTWEEGDNRWAFEQKSEKSYLLTVTEQPSEYTHDTVTSSRFEAHLVKLGDYYFLDLLPDEDHFDGFTILSRIMMIPAHLFVKIELQDDMLRLNMLDPEWFEQLVGQDKSAISYQIANDQYLLTASTDELQAFMLKYAGSEGAFGSAGEFKRID